MASTIITSAVPIMNAQYRPGSVLRSKGRHALGTRFKVMMPDNSCPPIQTADTNATISSNRPRVIHI